VGVTETDATVLRVLLRGSRIDDSVLRLDKQVGRTAVQRRIVESELQRGPRQDVLYEERLGVLVEVVRDRLRLALVLQPAERDVIVLHQAARAACAVGGAGNRDAGRVRGRIRERGDEVGEMPGLVDPGRIERRLSVLRADDK